MRNLFARSRGWAGNAALSSISIALLALVGGCAIEVDFVPDPPDDDTIAPVTSPDAAHAPKKGDVLIVGGLDANLNSSKIVEFFDPATRKFLATALLKVGTAELGAVALPSGKHDVIVAGGFTGKSEIVSTGITVSSHVVDTAQIFDPATGKFGAPVAMKDGRASFTATLLANGTVLLAGGFNPFGAPLDTAEIYNPKTGKFAATKGDMNLPRALHTATLLPDGTVLLVGGIMSKNGNSTDTAEIYDPASGEFSPLASVLDIGNGIAGHTATLIAGCGCANDGKVLIADGAIGFTLSGTNYLETDPFAMLYDPATQQFSAIGNNVPTDARALHTATLLADGRVLLAGGFLGAVSYTKNKFQGFSGDDLRISAEIFDPTDGTFTCVNGTSGMSCATAMTSSRGGHSATLLKSGPLAGMVLLAGGYGAPAKKPGERAVLSSAELFDPAKLIFTVTGAMTAPHVLHASTPVQ